MIISHKHKFIFIKTRKTGGTSIEIALSRYCGEKDIITPLRPASEQSRPTDAYGPQNYLGLFNPFSDLSYEWRHNNHQIFGAKYLGDHPVYGKIPASFWRTLAVMARFGCRKKYYNHIPASIVKKRVGGKIWNSYFKFCFERNPWDKTVSHYRFRKEKLRQAKTFAEYFEHGFFCSDFDAYAIDGVIEMDYVGRFEHLEGDLNQICDKIGIQFDGWIPHANVSPAEKQREPCQTCYTDEQKELIAKVFSREIEHFGYKFDRIESGQ